MFWRCLYFAPVWFFHYFIFLFFRKKSCILFGTFNKLCFLLSFFLHASVALVGAKTIVLVVTHQSKLDFWKKIYDEKISQVMLRFWDWEGGLVIFFLQLSSLRNLKKVSVIVTLKLSKLQKVEEWREKHLHQNQGEN